MRCMLGRLSLFHATVSTSTACGHVLLKASASFQRLTTRHNASTVVKSGVGQVLPPLIGQMSSFNPPRTLQETLEVVRIPPTGRNVGPRVEHIEVTADGQLADVISTALQLPAWFVLELLRFGAVHYCPIMPNPATAVRHLVAPEHLQRVEQLIAEGRARLGRNPKLQHPKRVHKDMPVGAGGYVRVHVHPKRFPAAYSVDWKQRILANMPEYVVVNKPAGVQVPPTVDNILESVVCCTATAVGLPQPHSALLNTHRLDAGTSGVVVLAKNAQFAHWFSSLLKDKPGNVVKLYKCLTSKPPPVGRMVHYATVKNRAPGEPAHTCMRPPTAANEQGIAVNTAAGGSSSSSDGDTQQPGVYCELVVLQVDEVQLTAAATTEWGATAYEATLQLVTGRTHQIRAQMAAEGCPLLGDHLYQALAVMWQQQQQQQQASYQACQQEAQQQHQQRACQRGVQGSEQGPGQQAAHESSFTGAEWSRDYQEDPLKPIGLQAHILRIRDVDGRMTAGGVQQQLQQQHANRGHAAPEEQQRARPGSCDPGRHTHETQECTVLQSSLDALVITSKDGALGGKGKERWIEFNAGVPWWRT